MFLSVRGLCEEGDGFDGVYWNEWSERSRRDEVKNIEPALCHEKESFGQVSPYRLFKRGIYSSSRKVWGDLTVTLGFAKKYYGFL